MLARTRDDVARRLDIADITGLPFELSHHRLDGGARVSLDGRRNPELLVVLTGSAVLASARGTRRVLGPGDVVLVSDGPDRSVAAGPGAELEYLSLTWSAGQDLTGLDGLVRSFDRGRMVWSYEMHLDGLLDAQAIPGLPFGSVFGSVPPGITSKRHCHQDGEIFLVLGGQAEVLVEQEGRELGRGDLVFLPPFHNHAIRNNSDEPFDLVSVYWEDIDAAAVALANSAPQVDGADRTVVVCPPITPNGGLHLGHLSGPYLRADLYARALRSTGREALVVTGTDDHQSFVATTAHRQGVSPQSVADAAGAQIEGTLAAVGVDLACLYRPAHDEKLAGGIRELFEELSRSPAVSAVTVETPWCANCAQSLYQSFATGRCPSCAAESDGEICEACGVPNTAIDLVDLTCGQCGGTPASRPEETLHLDLDKFAEPLALYLGRARGSGQSRRLADSLLRGGLGKYRITRHSQWGLGVSARERDTQVIDPWVELVLTQILNTRRFTEDDRTANVTVLGFDNTYFYLVLLPVVYLALGLEHLLPQGFVSNQFLHLDDSKFSTSRRHVVWADDLLEKVPVDLVRVALLRRSPEEEVRSIGSAEIDNLGEDPLIDLVDQALRDLPDEDVVPGTGAWTVHHRAFYRELCLCSEEFDHLLSVDAFSSVAYVEKLEALLRASARFRSMEQSRREISTAQEEARTSLALEYLALKVFAALAEPLMPAVGSLLWQRLGLPGQPRRERNWSFIPSGTQTQLAGLSVTRTLHADHGTAKLRRE